MQNGRNMERLALFVDSLSTDCAVFLDRLPAFRPAEVVRHMERLKLTEETLFLCHFAWCIASLVAPKLRLV